ncbi:YhjD/YihY/BrkB family envelope integrity protein [Mycoplasma sp. CSL10166]|uniref:YhjD/YihY/BrkB family envelope integrity protein n=1 Tax=Mycoplasma sp. CSL10166 TaxID=2813825 RepID=UPI00197C3B4A|nr:YhjD/YihY/BrkB family envelope integrity protein [Mycoplasma sp. CSL10166]MBN4084468.1 YihY/virulence factor BrkB family protein [Mycoplasma sp. CSL10166]
MKNTKINYKKLSKLRGKNSIIRAFYLNIIQPSKFIIFSIIYEKIIKYIISFFAFILIRANNIEKKDTRTKVVHKVYENFSTQNFTFIWLSITFYLLISVVPIIYIINFLNLTITDNISTLTNHVEVLTKEYNTNNTSIFQGLFNNIIFNKFIPGGQQYFNNNEGVEVIDDSFSKLYSLIPGSFIAIPSLYISAGGYGKIITAYNYMFSHDKVGTYWGNKLKGLFLVFAISILLFIFSNIYILIYASMIKSGLSKTHWILDVFYLFFSLVFFLVSFLVLFRLTPSFKLNFKSIWRGAIISTIPTFGLLIIYTYLNKVISYSKFGSAVGFFFTVGFFINWFSYFMFLGITFNEAYYKNYISTRTIPKKVYFWLMI